MALNIIKQINILSRRCIVNNKTWSRSSSLYEPDYLQIPITRPALYPMLNIQLQGYDYPMLEHYQSYVHKTLERWDLDVEDSWVMPPRTKTVRRYKPFSSVTIAEYELNIYERNIQVSNVSTIQCPLIIRILEATLPQGVSMTVDVYDPKYEMKRYVPDAYLVQLKNQLQDMEQGKIKK